MASGTKNNENSSKNSKKQQNANSKTNQVNSNNQDEQISSNNNTIPSSEKSQRQNSFGEDDGNYENSNSQSNNYKQNLKTQGRWTKEEHKKFIEGIQNYGRNWKKVEEHIGTRTGAQIRSHAQKFFNRLEKESQTSKLPEQFQLLLEKMNSSSHNNQSNGDTSGSTRGRQIISAVQFSSMQVQPLENKEEKEKKSNVNKQNQNSNANKNKGNNDKNKNNDGAKSKCLVNPLQNNNANEVSFQIGLKENTLTNLSINQQNLQENQDVLKQIIHSTSNNKQIIHDEIKFHDFFKNYFETDDSNDIQDSIESNNRLKMFYEQATRNPLYNTFNNHHSSQLPTKQNGSLNENCSSSHNNSSKNSHNSQNSPLSYTNYCNNNNNFNSQIYGLCQNSHKFGSHNNISYSQMKQSYDERDSEDIEKYPKQIFENNVQENSFFLEHQLNRNEFDKPKLYDMCGLGQQNYQSEVYIPNFKIGRSRFDSFKLHDEENESSNQKYQNFRKTSIEDYELKKRLKLNDGTANNKKPLPESQLN